MTRTFLLLFFTLANVAFGQTLTKAPVLVKQVEPVFPTEALDAGTGGKVVLEIDIGVDGKVANPKVTQSAGPAFDAAALTAVSQFEFTPAEIDGQPAPVRIQYTQEFVLKEQLVDASMVADSGVPVVNFTGTLVAAGTREPVSAALISFNNGAGDTVSDDKGHFEFTDVPVGKMDVLVSAAGFGKFSVSEEIRAGERTQATYYLRPENSNETIVRGEKDKREVTQVRISKQEMRLVPGTSSDAFKVVQNLPGVARSPFGTGALVVRGSKAWDSRIYIDEIQIPQLFHFAGLTATINSSVIDSIAFQPGNFGAEYGRSIGGLIQGDVRTPSKKGVHGQVDVNFFDVSALVEAPLNDQWSISASARKGLAEVVLPFAIKTFAPQLQSTVGFSLAPQYWDYQLRAEKKLGTSKDRLFIALYGSSDRYSFVQPNYFLDADTDGAQGNSGNSQLYNRLVVGIDQKLSDRVTFFSRNSVGFDIAEQLGGTSDIFFRNTSVPIQLRERVRIDVPEAKLVIGAGLDAMITPTVLEAQQPPTFRANQIPDPYVARRLIAQAETAAYIEPALFVDATWNPFAPLKIVGGVRVDSELGRMKKAWVDPRLSVRYEAWKFLTFKAAAGLYHQPPDYRTGLLSNTFGNPGLKPEASAHFMGGAEAKLFDLVEVEASGYYKSLFDQTRASLLNGAGSDLNIPGAATRYTSEGVGRSYGAEFLVRIKPTKYFFGWVAYTLSRFERDYYGQTTLAPGPLDQPHNLIVVGSVRLPWDIIAGARFRYTSGPLVTPVLGSIFDTNGNYYFPFPGLPWSRRLADFAQLDVRVDKKFTFDQWSLTAYVDIQNVTNARNPEALFYNFNFTQEATVYGIPILPTVGLKGEF